MKWFIDLSHIYSDEVYEYVFRVPVTWYFLWRFTVYPKKYAHGFCFPVLCCGYTLTDFPISTRLTSLALWQSNDCPSASKATQMNMDKYFMWIHYERLHNHNKTKHNKTVCIFLGIYCITVVCTSKLPRNSSGNRQKHGSFWPAAQVYWDAIFWHVDTRPISLFLFFFNYAFYLCIIIVIFTWCI